MILIFEQERDRLWYIASLISDLTIDEINIGEITNYDSLDFIRKDSQKPLAIICSFKVKGETIEIFEKINEIKPLSLKVFYDFNHFSFYKLLSCTKYINSRSFEITNFDACLTLTFNDASVCIIFEGKVDEFHYYEAKSLSLSLKTTRFINNAKVFSAITLNGSIETFILIQNAIKFDSTSLREVKNDEISLKDRVLNYEELKLNPGTNFVIPMKYLWHANILMNHDFVRLIDNGASQFSLFSSNLKTCEGVISIPGGLLHLPDIKFLFPNTTKYSITKFKESNPYFYSIGLNGIDELKDSKYSQTYI